jgi:cell division protein FtsI (penicillin-binding protein 3)
LLSLQEKKRVQVVGTLFACLYAGLLVRLYYVQIVYHDFFTGLGNQQYSVTISQPAKRGIIADRHGVALATNSSECSAFIMPNNLYHKEKLFSFLQEYLPEAYKTLQVRHDKKFMFIARHMSKSLEMSMKEAKNKDIHFMQEPARNYPYPACTPIIGTIDIDNQGIAGLELSLNQILAGTPSTYHLQKDAHSGHCYFEKEQITQGIDGKDIQLTIDASLQFLVHKKLIKHAHIMDCNEEGVIILDPITGDIVTMTTFLDNPAPAEKTRNCCIANAYEFGSICKLFVAAAALEEKLVTIDELIDCKNSKTTRIDGRTINTWKAHGIIPFKEVIAKSNNIGIALVAKRLDTALYEHYKALGFGKKLKIPLPGKHAGFVNHPARWSKQSLISLSYGYELSVTLLHLATAMATFAHDGYKVYPRLLLSDPVRIGKKLYSTETVEAVQQILQEATTNGTAHRAQIKGYTVLCKTGSAHMLVDGVYNKDKNIYSCVGIVQKDEYKKVIAVYVQKTGAGQKNTFASTIAAPLFEKVARCMLIHDRVIT